MSGWSFGVTCSCGGDVEHVTASAYRCDVAEWVTTTRTIVRCVDCNRRWMIRVSLNRA